MRRVVLVLATMALAILLAGGVAQAIINGEPDRGPDAHPYVGAYVTKLDGKLLPLCSGTLISPKVFLTAGHCTEPLIKEDLPSYVSFDPTYKPGASELVKGTPYLHPNYCSRRRRMCAYSYRAAGRWISPLRRRVGRSEGASQDGRVRGSAGGWSGRHPQGGPTPHHRGLRRDRIRKNRQRTAAAATACLQGDRYRATVRLLDTKDPDVGEMFVKTTGVSFIKSKGEASCYGDSGGPLFVGDQQTIVGVTSFGNGVCRGPAYYQRVDLPRVLKWVRSFP